MQLSVTSLSRFVQDSVIVIKFLETECVGSLEFAKTKVFAQLCHEGLSVTIHQRIVMSFESSCNKFFVNSLGPTASMSSTCTAMQMSSSVFLQLARQMFLPASRRCSETQHGLTHSPNHTSAIRQNLRVPAFGWLCVLLFAFTDFSVEKSLCVVCHKTPCREHTDALYCCCTCKATFIIVRLFITSRSVLGSLHCRSFHRVYPATRHDVCTSRQLVLVHLFDFHALQEIELFLTSFGRHCHVFVRSDETFHCRVKAVTHFMSLLKS